MRCVECGRAHHVACWTRHEGCGEPFCTSWRCSLPGPDPWLFVDGDGSCEVVSRLPGPEGLLLLTSFAGLLAHIPPFFWWSWVWLEPLARALALVPLLPFLIVRLGLRHRVQAVAAVRSLNRSLTLFGLTLRRRPGFFDADEAVELHLRADDADEDTLARLRRQRDHGLKGRRRRVGFTVLVLGSDGTSTPVFSHRTELEDEVVAVAERMAGILGCPVRRLYRGDRLTEQQVRGIVGLWRTGIDARG